MPEARTELLQSQLIARVYDAQQPLRIRSRMKDAGFVERVGLQALEQVRIGVLLVDHAGQVAFANASATAVLQPPCPIRVVSNRIRLGDPAQHNRLLALVRDAIGCGGDGPQRGAAAMTVPRCGRFPLAITIVPLRPGEGFGDLGPPAMLLVRDPECADMPLELLQAMFGFTGTEAAVANLLAGGKSVSEIAQHQGVSEATVRTQVRALLAKTNTTRQAEFVSLLLRSALPVRADQR
jgi:DNA-binding CsgD family transcriptional regulator